jgi:hypothetical protein
MTKIILYVKLDFVNGPEPEKLVRPDQAPARWQPAREMGGRESTAREFVSVDGGGAPVVTDGPFPEYKELLAGYQMVDVESEARAIEIAAKVSAAPGPGGAPIRQRIEVREVMGRLPGVDL